MANRYYYFTGRIAGSIPRRSRAESWFRSVKAFEPGLQELGYAPAPMPVEKLGLPKLEGTPPELQAIKEQSRMAEGRTAFGRSTAWGSSRAGALWLGLLASKFKEASEQCETDFAAKCSQSANGWR